MTSHLDSHTTNDVKSEMLSGVQTRNGIPHDKFNIRGTAQARTNRKDDIFMQRWLVQSFTYILEWGARNLYIDKARMALDIFCFEVFFGPNISIKPKTVLTQIILTQIFVILNIFLPKFFFAPRSFLDTKIVIVFWCNTDQNDLESWVWLWCWPNLLFLISMCVY